MIEEKILSIINSIQKNRGRNEVTAVNENTHLRNDLSFDSLDLAELTVKIEAQFGIDIFETGIVNTIGEIYSKLKQ